MKALARFSLMLLACCPFGLALLLPSGCATSKSPSFATATEQAAIDLTRAPNAPAVSAGLASPGRAWRGTPQPLSSSARSRALTRLAAAMPLSGEELWVLARGTGPATKSENEMAGSGELMAEINGQQIPMPLKHTDVRASISGYVGEVRVTQQFLNPYSGKIEAVYVFPLPHNAAVNEFIMTIGERRIRGIIRERQEAEQIYKEAKRQGYVASLLTEERPNVFTQSVANIEPGKQIDIDIRYFHTLAYADGWYEFVFPMVVGPRFNPPGSTQGIGAVARGQSGLSGQQTEVHYLKPGEQSPHDISLQVDLDAGVPIEEVECKTHEIVRELASAEKLRVTLSPADRLPNRDFVLRYRVAGARIKSSLLTSRDERGSYFTLMLFPPEGMGALRRQAVELVFVLDSSGSMSGRPIQQAKAAVERGLQLLQPGDSFQLINFANRSSQLGPEPLAATPENVRRGLEYLNAIEGSGGTMMIEGIKAALDFPHDPERLRFVCFLTDGYIGNEVEILSEIHRRLGAARIFSFGIGSSVNRYLLDHMAQVGRGAVAYLGPRDRAAKIMEDFFTRVSHPALTDLAIDWGGLQATDVYPQTVPDLFVGRPVVLTGRFAGNPAGTIRVSGKIAGEPTQLDIPAAVENSDASHPGLASVWARMKMTGLANRSVFEPNSELASQIKQVALDYGLMSPFTAFVAVDSTRRTAGTEGTTVPVAVPVPEGVKYETTVEEK